MKIASIALCAAGCIASAASAQSSVTVYGLVDAGITAERGGADGNVTKVASGVQSGSRLGFKGTEDLGGGLYANFKLESGFDGDTGKTWSTFFGRHAYVGVSGAFGALNIGRQCNPLFLALDTIDPFETGLTGASTNLMSVGSFRTNNSLTYTTPDAGNGWSATLLYGAGEVAGNSSLGRTVDVSIDYARGPLVLTLAYDTVKQSLLNSSRVMLAGGMYNTGPATLHAAYQTERNDLGANFRTAMAGLSVPLGSGKLLASYIRKTDRATGRLGGAQGALGYSHPLSKRTNLYTSYGHIGNNEGASNYVGDASGGGSAPLPGQSSSAFTAGIRHKF